MNAKGTTHMRIQISILPTENLLGHHEVAFVAGLADVPEGWAEAFDEHVGDLLVSIGDDGCPLSISPARMRPLDEAVPADVRRALSRDDIDRFVTARIHRTPPTERSNCEVLFRLTELASGFGGGSVLVFAGTLCVEDAYSLNADSIHELAADDGDLLEWRGRVGEDVRRHFGAPSMVSRMSDAPLFRAFDLAVWGFGHEPMALGATTPLAFIQRCERYHDLFFKDARCADEDLELEELRETMVAAGVSTLDRTPNLAAALARFRTSKDYVSPFAPRSRVQQAASMTHFAACWTSDEVGTPTHS
jgi:hypothetical protein